jgi:hypothetical protein
MAGAFEVILTAANASSGSSIATIKRIAAGRSPVPLITGWLKTKRLSRASEFQSDPLRKIPFDPDLFVVLQPASPDGQKLSCRRIVATVR